MNLGIRVFYARMTPAFGNNNDIYNLNKENNIEVVAKLNYCDGHFNSSYCQRFA